MPFLLTSEPWIPCTTPSNGRVEFGLRDVIVRAHDLAEIHDPSPLITLALHRLVLAVLHRVFGPPDLASWRLLFERGAFDAAAVDDYLGSCTDRMDLLHPDRPFYQTRGLRKFYEADGLSRLVFERSNYGSPVLVFQHRPAEVQDAEVMPLADAARSLLALQAFAPGGLVKKKDEPGSATACPLNRGAYVLVRGRSLFETLLFNLLVLSDDQPVPTVRGKDRPSWEQDPLPRPMGAKEPARPAYGWMDQLTFQSRRLELELNEDQTGVKGVVYCVGQGLTLQGLMPEPMLAYRTGKKKMGPVELSEGRAVWRDCHALVQFAEEGTGRPPLAVEQLRRRDLRELTGGQPLSLDVLGMRGDQAKIKLTRHERLSVPAAIVVDRDRLGLVRESAQLAEDVGLAVLFAVKDAVRKALAPGDRDPDPADVSKFTDSLAPQRRYWAALAAPFEALLDNLARDRTDAAQEFANAIRRAANNSVRSSVQALGTSARQLQGGAIAERQLAAAFARLMPARGEA